MRTVVALLALVSLTDRAAAQCSEPPLANYTGGGATACPCFVSGEEAGVVLTAPAAHYPIEITKIRIAWGSVFGGQPQSLEQGIHLYANGLPNPGARQFTLPGPVLTDGFLNEFDVSSIPGNKTLLGGPFTVSLEFLNTNANMVFSPTVVHDGNGCQGGKNAVKAIPGGWADACALGVSGDWVMEVVYELLGTATVLNGTGANPLTLINQSAPSLGQSWDVDLDCSAHAPSAGLVLGYTGLLGAPFGTKFGELIVDTGSLQVLKLSQAHGGGTASFSSAIPNDPALCGLTMYAQGACLGSPGAQLSNALAVRVGS